MMTIAHLEDEGALLDQARQGDGAAYVKLFKQYDRHIYRLAYSILRNPADAEDVLQDVALKALAHLKDFRGQSRFYSWIARIATNECLMRLRRKGAQQLPMDDSSSEEDGPPLPLDIADWRDTPEQAYLVTELQAMVAEGMEKLCPVSRLVFQLRDIEQLSTEETAQLIGVTATAVKTRLFRARLKMREHMNAYFKEGVKTSCAARNS